MKNRVLWRAGFVVALGALAGSPSFAQSTTDCSAVPEDMARLKCYDEQAARQKKKTAPAPAAVAPAPAKPAASARTEETAAPRDFGAETIRKSKSDAEAAKASEQVVARVKAVDTKPRGEYLITLEDGQVWEETHHSSEGTPPRVGETVTLKRGMLGSYFLSRSAGLALRVKRVR